MSRLRSYAPMSKVSAKVAAEASAFQAVYAAVDLRSEGRCEVSVPLSERGQALFGHTTRPAFNVRDDTPRRCVRRAVDHHHLYKPRRSNHVADQVIAACRVCHDRMDYPYPRGRLCFVGRMGTAFLFAIRYTSDKPFRSSGTLTP